MPTEQEWENKVKLLEADRDRWRALAHSIFNAVNENGKTHDHPSIQGKKQEWPRLWTAIDAVVEHVSTLHSEEQQ